MIQLDRHIEILLLDNDCVIVPGLGGFMAHHVCAKYYPDYHEIIPPIRQLCFNSQLQINDSLLVQSYIEAYDISYPEALRRIEDEVNELKQILRNVGSCELHDLGVLSLNVEGHIEFTPCESGVLSPTLYALDLVVIKPLAECKSKPVEKAAEQSPEVSSDTNNPITVPSLTLVDDEEDNDEEGETIKIKVRTLKRIASIAAVVVALIVLAIPVGMNMQPQMTQSAVDTNIFTKVIPSFVGKIAKDSIVKQKAELKVATPVVSTPVKKPEITQVKENDEHFYSIVLASRVTKKNAQIFIDQLKDSGFDKAEMVQRTNGAKVIYGHFQSEDEARQFLRRTRACAEAFTDGWVMEF